MSFETIAAKEIDNFIGLQNTLIVDVRDAEEYHQGHIKTAINIPYDNINDYINNLALYQRVILYCDRGSMSLLVCRDLCRRGIYVINVCGGIHAYRGQLYKD